MAQAIKSGKDYCENWCLDEIKSKCRNRYLNCITCSVIKYLISQGFTIAKFPTPFGREGKEQEVNNDPKNAVVDVEKLLKTCYYCNTTPYKQTQNIGQQKFNDGTMSNVKLNPYDTSFLTVDTWNVPIKGREANNYTITQKINFCPMCGRRL